MIQLNAALNAWGTPAFESIFKRAIEQLDVAELPLQRALARSSYTDGLNRSVTILQVSDDAAYVRVKAGILYSGIIPGCSCADDPTPISELTEYCEVQVDIDKQSAETRISLLND